MEKTGFFTALGAHLKTNRLFYLLVLFIVLSVGGYFWWQAGFTLDINKFFAAPLSRDDGGGVTPPLDQPSAGGPAACENLANHYCIPNSCQPGHSEDTSSSCSNTALKCCRVPTTTVQPTVTATTTATAAPTSSGDICSSIPAGARKWTQNGVTVCILSETFTPQPAVCTIKSTPGNLTYRVGIINRSTQAIYSKPAIFRSDVADCRAIQSNSGNAAGYVTGTKNLAPGQSGQTTYTFTIGTNECGAWQLDDSWGPGDFVFVIGKVINTGRTCPTPTVTTTTTVTPTITTTVTPTPIPMDLSCQTLTPSANIGQTVQFRGHGGTGSYSWYAPGSNQAEGLGTLFNTTYSTAGFKTVTVVNGNNQATCTTTINIPATPTITPTPTVTTTTTVTPAVPVLNIQKLVRNITQNSGETDSVSANPSDTVEFSVTITSAGSTAALDVISRDALPSGLSYQAGTTTIDGVLAADGFTGSGLTLGTMTPGRSITLRFRATVANADFFSVGTSSLINTAYAQGSNVPQVSDTAIVNVTRVGQLNMSLTKTGRNLTRGQTGELTSVSASPEENIEFVLRVRNTSSATLTNVTVRDIIPQGITYQPGSARLNGQIISDTLAGTGVNIGSLVAGQEAVITFIGRVAMASNLPTGTTTLINTAQASADSIPTLTAQLPVIVSTSVIVIPPVETGPGETTILALIVSAIITLLYVGYTGTDMFRRHEAGRLAKEARRDHGLFDFKR